MSATYQAVFFDLGGTLFSYRGLRRGSSLIVDAARRLGVESEPRALGRAYRAASQQAYARLAPQRFYLHRDLFRDTFRSFARELGRDPPEELVSWYEGAQRESLLEHMQPMDDCLEVLNAMRARGLYLSIVSNIDDDLLLPLVEKWGLDQLLDDWTSSEEARSCKPDPWIYRTDWAYTNVKDGRLSGFVITGTGSSPLGRIGYMGGRNPDLLGPGRR